MMDGVILTLAQEGVSVGCDFHSSETSVWMTCGLGKSVKSYVVISWPWTNRSVHWAKWSLFSRLSSDKITTHGYMVLNFAKCITIMIAELAVTSGLRSSLD